MKNTSLQRGFSLIEVMVATVLLMVIVTMVALVFRQNVLVWNSGMRRAEGMALVRLALGTIERDLRNAVDGSLPQFTGWGTSSGTSDSMQVYDNKLAFAAFLGDDDRRELVRVTYDFNTAGGGSLTRTVTALRWNGVRWEADVAKLNYETESVLIDVTQSSGSEPQAQKPRVEITFSKGTGGSGGGSSSPKHVTVHARLITTEEFSSIRVRSLGEKGRVEDTSSHIEVW